MSSYNLRDIFSYLVEDDNFLLTVIETNKYVGQKKNKKKSFNLLTNMVTDYIPLLPSETQNYNVLPNNIKNLLTPDYVRCGIKNTIDKNLCTINISFLNSLNILLRPAIYKSNIDDQIKNFVQLESFLCHTIERNYQIDKTKRTKKVQAFNKELIKNLKEGKISRDLIETIINIFEINLLIFDLTKMDIHFYWTKGSKYPFFNPFKNICCMTYLQGNYEPIMPLDSDITEEQKRKIYENIFIQLDDIKCVPNLNISVPTMIYINTWELSPLTYFQIIKKIPTINKSINKIINDLEGLCKK